jgi:hypothetical protein
MTPFGMSSIRLLVLCLNVLGFSLTNASVRYGYGAIEVPDGFSPRYYLGASPAQALERRQSGDCGTDQHSCII